MANQELYKQAIADAKKLKDISMAQAKEAIAEAFNPRIQEMFRLKLSELEEESEEDAHKVEEGHEEGTHDVVHMEEEELDPMEESEVNEMTLEEILAELEEGDMEEEADLEEAGTGYEAGKQEPQIEEADEEAEVEKLAEGLAVGVSVGCAATPN